jgi:cell division protein FtsI/penicillin-binding protein 2
MLQQVVMAGTGIRAVIPGYLVAGKTGTAEVPNPHALGYIYGQYNATFAGFAPANHPVLSMLVVLQRPLRSYYGGTAACPVFQRVMSYALHHYGIVPDGVSNKPVPGISSDVKSDVT